MATPNKENSNNEREFSFERDTPFYEERSYGHCVGNGYETHHVDTYSEEEKTEWLKNN